LIETQKVIQKLGRQRNGLFYKRILIQNTGRLVPRMSVISVNAYGIEVIADHFHEAVALTETALLQRRPLFEAALIFVNLQRTAWLLIVSENRNIRYPTTGFGFVRTVRLNPKRFRSVM